MKHHVFQIQHLLDDLLSFRKRSFFLDNAFIRLSESSNNYLDLADLTTRHSVMSPDLNS